MKAGAPPHLFDQFSLKTHSQFTSSHFVTNIFDNIFLCVRNFLIFQHVIFTVFSSKKKKSNIFFVKTIGSTAVLCGLLHTLDRKSLKSLNQKKVRSLKNPTWIFTDYFLNVFVLKSCRLMKFTCAPIFKFS